jgi:hypothetical protein
VFSRRTLRPHTSAIRLLQATTTAPATIRKPIGFARHASANCPCTIALTLVVKPQEGQGRPVKKWMVQGGSPSCWCVPCPAGLGDRYSPTPTITSTPSNSSAWLHRAQPDTEVSSTQPRKPRHTFVIIPRDGLPAHSPAWSRRLGTLCTVAPPRFLRVDSRIEEQLRLCLPLEVAAWRLPQAHAIQPRAALQVRGQPIDDERHKVLRSGRDLVKRRRLLVQVLVV